MKSNRAMEAAVNDLTRRYDIEAADYRDYWAPLLAPISAELVSGLDPQGASHVLDVGTGVGNLLPVLREHFDNASVFGVDRSEGMVSLATGNTVAVMDARALAISDASIDVAIMSFVLFHLPDPVAGLRELYRVLRPGGRVAITTWAADITSVAVDTWNDVIDQYDRGDAPARLAQHELMDSPEKVAAILDSAAFLDSDIEVRGFEYQTNCAEFLHLRTAIGRSRQRLDGLGAARRMQCIAEAEKRLADLPPEAFTIRSSAVLAYASKPGD